MTAPAVGPSRPEPSLDRASITGVVIAVMALVGFVASADDDGFVVCLFRRCTGGYCPGCGATRAARRLVVGDVSGSWSQHPWVVFAAVQAVAVGTVLAVTDRAHRRSRARRLSTWLIGPNAIALVVIYVVRLVDGSIPRPF